MLIVVVLLATVMLRFTIVATVAYLMRRLLPLLEHRWCLRCGWTGLVRRDRRPRTDAQSRVITRAARS